MYTGLPGPIRRPSGRFRVLIVGLGGVRFQPDLDVDPSAAVEEVRARVRRERARAEDVEKLAGPILAGGIDPVERREVPGPMKSPRVRVLRAPRRAAIADRGPRLREQLDR